MASETDVVFKTDAQIEGIRRACQLAAQVLDAIEGRIRPGVSTGAIDDWCAEEIAAAGATSAALNYQPPGQTPFPKSVCTSVNHTVCHGIPSHSKLLRDGDIVNVDVTVVLGGYFGDTSRMYSVGTAAPLARALCEGTRECLMAGIAAVAPGVPLGEIGNAIQTVASRRGYSVVQEFCGHGTGLAFHEAPQVLHYRNSRSRLSLQPNMVFTVEPMINAGKRHIKMLADGWTVVTRDRSLSAQWEHTILVTEQGSEILTVNGQAQG